MISSFFSSLSEMDSNTDRIIRYIESMSGKI